MSGPHQWGELDESDAPEQLPLPNIWQTYGHASSHYMMDEGICPWQKTNQYL